MTDKQLIEIGKAAVAWRKAGVAVRECPDEAEQWPLDRDFINAETNLEDLIDAALEEAKP